MRGSELLGSRTLWASGGGCRGRVRGGSASDFVAMSFADELEIGGSWCAVNCAVGGRTDRVG